VLCTRPSPVPSPVAVEVGEPGAGQRLDDALDATEVRASQPVRRPVPRLGVPGAGRAGPAERSPRGRGASSPPAPGRPGRAPVTPPDQALAPTPDRRGWITALGHTTRRGHADAQAGAPVLAACRSSVVCKEAGAGPPAGRLAHPVSAMSSPAASPSRHPARGSRYDSYVPTTTAVSPATSDAGSRWTSSSPSTSGKQATSSLEQYAGAGASGVHRQARQPRLPFSRTFTLTSIGLPAKPKSSRSRRSRNRR
jgi:hypothetical protein